MFRLKSDIAAQLVVALAVAALFFWGLHMLTVSLFDYEGLILIGLAVLLAYFRKHAAQRLIWIFSAMHRVIAGILMAGVAGMEGLMHAFNIPHLEGWWMPVLGSGALAGVIAAWVQKWKRK